MSTVRSYLFIAGLSILTGCASTPKVGAFGPYFQIFVNEEPVVEYAYKSAAQCEKVANDAVLTSGQTAQQLIASGKMRFACSASSQAGKLPHKAELVVVMTDTKYQARFKSAAACKLALSNIKGGSETLKCD